MCFAEIGALNASSAPNMQKLKYLLKPVELRGADTDTLISDQADRLALAEAVPRSRAHWLGTGVGILWHNEAIGELTEAD